MIATWQAPLANGKITEELLLTFDQKRDVRVLVLPALFDEANKLRRVTLQIMRALDAADVDTFLPDLPGCNESLEPLTEQTLSSWRLAATAAAEQVSATHVFTIRAGALIAPAKMQGWLYAPQTGPKMLRGMLRARTIAAREAGLEETSEALMETGREDGLVLAGWPFGSEMLCELEAAEDASSAMAKEIKQTEIGGGGLWLRAEPDEDQAQANAIAALISGKQVEAL